LRINKVGNLAEKLFKGGSIKKNLSMQRLELLSIELPVIINLSTVALDMLADQRQPSVKT